ncbi:GYDIA family GHMP kinase [Flavobacterium psychrotolerans]|uniref:GHMP kinase n=1 Tax=Flavobacterium psychrotolerans TaxID=2169410 RepID=A0A2U1JGG9_9FLAO|nr:GYDIA family GHMP kinase [Flavobacterium psychrotolerans]PWA04099.1 GHMP kinase [Flavobacterium psychrotolerans]
MTTKKTYYSNGKLLITGEYVVLDGALAFALPTKFGQDLVVENGTKQEISWKSFDQDGSIWFEKTIPFSDIVNKTVFENQPEKNTLIAILHEAYRLNPKFINESKGYIATTHLTFPKFWGLGTSSTLINNIAQWINIDAYTLLKNSFGGSGYDIACAQNDTPILYRLVDGKPIIEKISFSPDFTKHLYFVYLNKKQSSKTAIDNYYKKQNSVDRLIPTIDTITKTIIHSKDIETFVSEIENHEKIMSGILETKTVKDTLFPDFTGTIKSLGAWGGDFVLVVSKENPTYYFKEKGYETILPCSEIIL